MSAEQNRDRLAERRQATVDEILDAAWRFARSHGLAAMSLRDIAGDIGMRPQSLYSYFTSKNDMYDAMFAQAARQFADGQSRWHLTGDALHDLQTIGRYFMRFCLEDPPRYQLLFQRTIPGFEPSSDSFAISVESLEGVRKHLASLGIDEPRDIDLFTAIGTGLTDQQISNDPGGDRWSRLVDDAVEMFLDHVRRRR